jgi:TolB-like protein
VNVTVTNLRPVEQAGASGNQIVHTFTMPPTGDEIRQQLERILVSGGFAHADRMTAFLRYVVERALAGEGDQVKEYTIGVDVFGRDGDYDPRLDSIVRVEARRLRSKLDEYYANGGAHDAVVIRMPRGTYVPIFERKQVVPVDRPQVPAPRHDEDEAETRQDSGPHTRPLLAVGLGLAVIVLAAIAVVSSRPGGWRTAFAQPPAASVAVLPFASYSSDEDDRLLAARLTDGITKELARLGTIGVVSHTSASQFAAPRGPASQVGMALNVPYLIEGSVTRHGDRLELSLRLVKADIDRKVWVQDFEGSVSDPGELERRAALAAAPEVLKPRR